MKRIISIIIVLATVLSLGLVPTVNGAGLSVFTDVKKGAWYETAVLTVNVSGIMEGKGDGKFAPNASMTRAELVTVLYRLSEETFFGSDDALNFRDVKKSAWYAEAVAWAVKNGLATGYPNGTFKPNAPILRQELAKMLVTFLEYMEITGKGDVLADSFRDSARFPDWAAAYIESLRQTGLMGGDDAGNFKPKAKASRAEIAMVITRLLPLMVQEDNGGSGGSSDYTPTPAPDDFELCEEAEAPYPYYIRFPDGYSESEKYPLVIFTAGDAETSVASVGACFYSEESPAYDSIVMIPGVGSKDDLEECNGLYSYVTEKYAVDTERVYIISTGKADGNFFTWKMLEKDPTVVSAVLYVHGGISAVGKGDGESLKLEGFFHNRITEEALEGLRTLPIYYHHCTDEKQYEEHFLYPNYDEMISEAFADAGMTKTVIVSDTGYPTIYDDFAVRNNGAAFDWLFAQRRETK